MPYFKNKYINILLIHIPKTGGTSLETYFSSAFKIPLNNKSLYLYPDSIIKKITKIQSSLQHMTYQQIVQHQKLFQIDFNDIQIITSVRNPYDRIVSDLFWNKLIYPHSTKEDIFKILQKYVVSTKYDNHNLPQYLFVTKQNKLIPHLHVLRTETLTRDMKKIGFINFNVHVNTNNKKKDYYSYLNEDSIAFINDFYHFDFFLFNYPKLPATGTPCNLNITTNVYPIVQT